MVAVSVPKSVYETVTVSPLAKSVLGKLPLYDVVFRRWHIRDQLSLRKPCAGNKLLGHRDNDEHYRTRAAAGEIE
ncbi:MAG TPA: hypothetical protein VGN04_01925 [Herbaspirillum sp.]|jgi:hypothetical protein